MTKYSVGQILNLDGEEWRVSSMTANFLILTLNSVIGEPEFYFQIKKLEIPR